jgi:hypothetical protein
MYPFGKRLLAAALVLALTGPAAFGQGNAGAATGTKPGASGSAPTGAAGSQAQPPAGMPTAGSPVTPPAGTPTAGSPVAPPAGIPTAGSPVAPPDGTPTAGSPVTRTNGIRSGASVTPSAATSYGSPYAIAPRSYLGYPPRTSSYNPLYATAAAPLDSGAPYGYAAPQYGYYNTQYQPGTVPPFTGYSYGSLPPTPAPGSLNSQYGYPNAQYQPGTAPAMTATGQPYGIATTVPGYGTFYVTPAYPPGIANVLNRVYSYRGY